MVGHVFLEPGQVEPDAVQFGVVQDDRPPSGLLIPGRLQLPGLGVSRVSLVLVDCRGRPVNVLQQLAARIAETVDGPEAQGHYHCEDGQDRRQYFHGRPP